MWWWHEVLDTVVVWMNGGYAVNYRAVTTVQTVFVPILLAAYPCALLLACALSVSAVGGRSAFLRKMGIGLCLLYLTASTIAVVFLYVMIFVSVSSDDAKEALRAKQAFEFFCGEVLLTWALLGALVLVVRIACLAACFWRPQRDRQ